MKISNESNWLEEFFAPPPLDVSRQLRGLRRYLPDGAMQRDLYSEAVRFATERLKDPEVRRFFKARRMGKQSTFTAAVDMYIDVHCPFDPSCYRIRSN